MTPICVGKLTIIGSDNGWKAPSHYLNQCRNIVNWTLGNKLQRNFNRNSNIFIEENTFENVLCEMLFISSRPQCVKCRVCIIDGGEISIREMAYHENSFGSSSSVVKFPSGTPARPQYSNTASCLSYIVVKNLTVNITSCCYYVCQ